MTQQAYLVFDIGTGNARVAVTDIKGQILAIERDDIAYEQDSLYPDACHFQPDVLWEQIAGLAKLVLSRVPDRQITAITSTSQRQGIVLIDEAGESYVGLPNIDNRGREWEEAAGDPSAIYNVTGRTPSALFSVMKLVGLRERRPEQFARLARFTSISDWVTYMLSGQLIYEPSQACETLLYDVQQAVWSTELADQFGIPVSALPPLSLSGTIAGALTARIANELRLPAGIPVIVGGGDTQLAMNSTHAQPGDIVIVSGTTTPIARITDRYTTDPAGGAWINAHTYPDQWLVETNPGITGLNYQRLQAIFYPNEGYAIMEQEIANLEDTQCVSALGAYLSSQKNARVRGGFLFDAPLSDKLSRAHFVRAALEEIAFSVKINYDQLADVINVGESQIWACGGGLQSRLLVQTLADLLGKEIHVSQGYEQASVAGAVKGCNLALGITAAVDSQAAVFAPQPAERLLQDYKEWHRTQQQLFAVRQAEQEIEQAEEAVSIPGRTL